MKPYLWQFLLFTIAGWINRVQQDAKLLKFEGLEGWDWKWRAASSRVSSKGSKRKAAK